MATAYVATGSGLLRTPTNWTPNGVPGSASGDSITVPGGISITLDQKPAYPISGVVGAAGAGVLATLDLQADLDLGGSLTIGNGTGAAGALNFGAGVTLNLGAYDLIRNNCQWTSSATRQAPARVIGTGNILDGAASVRSQSLVLSFVSFLNTGHARFGLAGSGAGNGGFSNELDLNHVAFKGQTYVLFGTSGVTPLSTLLRFRGVDFRSFTSNLYNLSVGLTGQAGQATGLSMENCTFFNGNHAANFNAFGVNNFRGGRFHHLAFVDFGLITTGAYNQDFDAIFLSTGAFSVPGGTSWFIGELAGGTNRIRRSYFFLRDSNNHLFGMSGNGPGAHWIDENVFENQFNFDGSNVIPSSWGTMLSEKNILIVYGTGGNGGGSLDGSVSAKTPVLRRARRETVYFATGVSSTVYGAVWYSENSALGGTNDLDPWPELYVTSSLCVGGQNPVGVCVARNGSPAQRIKHVGYHDWVNCNVDRYKNVTAETPIVNDLAPGDVVGLDPKWVDPTRRLLTFVRSMGSGGDEQVALDAFKGMNGLNETTFLQTNPDSGWDIRALCKHVREGFRPRNWALRGRSDPIDGRGDTGACPVKIMSRKNRHRRNKEMATYGSWR